jgi:hypothetical protein
MSVSSRPRVPSYAIGRDRGEEWPRVLRYLRLYQQGGVCSANSGKNLLGFRDPFGFVGGSTRNSSSGAFGDIISLTTIAGFSRALLGGKTIGVAYDLYRRRASSSALLEKESARPSPLVQ